MDVQHRVLSRLVRQHGTRQVFDLHEVAFEVDVPAEFEFPRTLSRLDMFLRVAAADAGPTRVRIRVHHEQPRGRWKLRHDLQDARYVIPFPMSARVVHDQPFRLSGVRLEGPGMHAVTVYFRPESDDAADGWNPNTTPWDPDEAGWEFGAVEYFRVVRGT